MPITQWLLLNIPAVLLGFIVVGISVVLSLLTSFITSLIIPESKSSDYGGMAVILFVGTALIYSILLTVVIFTSWTGFNDADTNVQKEANCIVELYRIAEAFPSATRQNIQGALEEYTRSIIDKEWAGLARSQLDKHTNVIGKKFLPEIRTG